MASDAARTRRKKVIFYKVGILLERFYGESETERVTAEAFLLGPIYRHSTSISPFITIQCPGNVQRKGYRPLFRGTRK